MFARQCANLSYKGASRRGVECVNDFCGKEIHLGVSALALQDIRLNTTPEPGMVTDPEMS